MRKLIRSKMFITLLIASGFIIFVRTVPQVSLVERAIVIGLGIDYEDEMFTVTTQIIKPVSSVEGATNNGYGLEYETAKTLGEGLNKLTQKTGLNISLAQCNLIILGKGVVETAVCPSINYIINTWQLPEQGIVVATEERAIDILRTQLVSDTISSFLIQKSIMSQQDNILSLTTMTKDYLRQHHSYSKTSVIPYITKKPVNPKDIGGSEDSADSDDTIEEFDFTKSVAIIENKKSLILDSDDTISINYVKKNIKCGVLEIETDELLVGLCVKGNKAKTKVISEGDKVIIEKKLNIKMIIGEIENMGECFSINEITEEMMTEISKKAKEHIEKQIEKTFAKSKAENVDFLNLYDIIYAKQGLKWKNSVDENYLEKVYFKVIVDIDLTRR